MTALKRLLVIRFSAMGDVAMTVPVVKAFLDQNSDTEITYLSRLEFSAIFTGIPRLTFIGAQLKGEHNGFPGLMRLYKHLIRSGNFYALADLHDSLRTRILRTLFRFSGLNYAFIDKGRPEKKLLTRYPGKVLHPLKPTTERYADVFRKLGFALTLDHQLKRTEQVLDDSLVAITGKKDRPWVGIAPFAKHKGKIYPLERTAEVIRELSQKDVRIFLFGGSVPEEEICREWEAQYTNVTSTVRQLNMQQELMLIGQLEVMMSMDSAGMHLASLSGVPVVSVWGATHHFAGFLGYGQLTDNIVADTIECRPCSVYGDRPCFRKDYACLYNIPAQTIVARLNEFIA